MADLDMAIRRYQESVNQTPLDHPERARQLQSLGFGYHTRYQQTGNMTDLDTAIQRYQESVNQTPSNHPERAGRLQNLGAGYHDRYERIGNMTDLKVAIERFQDSVDLTSEGHPERAGRLQGLGKGYRDRYQRTGDTTDLKMAIERFQESVDLTLEGHPERAGRLQDLGVGYGNKYQQTGDMKDLEMAIKRFQDSVDLTSEGHPERARQLHDLGAGYGNKYQQTGDTTYLKMAIERFQECVDLTPEGHLERARRLQSLGKGYHDRYLRMEDTTDINTAIKQLQGSVDLTPDGHSERAGRLQDLGAAYNNNYQRTGDTTSLEIAIERFQESVDLTPNGHPKCAERFQSLGKGYRDRYQRTGDTTYLKMAIERFQESVDLTSKGHPERAGRLQSLGAGYHDRYQRTGDTTDLEMAIERFQESIDLTPDGYPERAERFQDLAVGYSNKYQRTGDTTDLEMAIEQFQKSVDLTPEGHSKRAGRLRDLGAIYHDKHHQTDNATDLETAIQRLQQSVDLTPEGYSERAVRLQDLGAVYRHRYQRTGDTRDLDTATKRFQESVDHAPSPVRERLMAAITLLPLYADTASWNEAYGMANTALRLVPLLAPRFLKNADKQHLLATVAGLASDSAATALCATKDSFDALQLLELGRGVISGSLSEMRTDTTALLNSYPELGQEYINLRNLLDSPEIPEERDLLSSSNNRSNLRYDAWNRMDKLLSDIRNQHGFEDFLLAPRREYIQSAAKSGPIVIINVSECRCDAILVEQHDISSLALSKLSSEDIKEKTRKRDFGSSETLEWMWNTIANPVLEALNLTHPPSNGRWPHIWWIPTGLLTKFPLHAAGRHKANFSETVIDRVMSSYGSSIKAILHGRSSRFSEISPSALPQALLVAVPNAPGSFQLRFATKEVATLHKLCKSMKFDPIEPGRRKSDVISHLPRCKIFHFAGHGFTDSIDPSGSYLLLEDGKSDPLTVATLLEMNIQEHSPFLAYLSACGTGQISDARFLDESIHLISAFQLAGFRHVIGTLWEVNDEVCVDVASITYEGMRDGNMTDESVCLGLHNAIRKLRDDWLFAKDSKRGLSNQSGARDASHGDQRDDRLPRDGVICEDDEEESLSWVPYIHFGV